MWIASVTEAAPKSKRGAARTGTRTAKPIAPLNVKPSAAAAAALRRTSRPAVPRGTKQEQMLTLLNRADGVTLAELVDVTKWQPHSVRGFLAGTVKTKLGLTLTSLKAKGQDRRYRIEPKRGR